MALFITGNNRMLDNYVPFILFRKIKDVFVMIQQNLILNYEI